MKRALLIVEPDFHRLHVGVRRVIMHYWSELARAGFDVEIATPRHGALFRGHLTVPPATVDKPRVADLQPYWTSTAQHRKLPDSQNETSLLVKWLDDKVQPDEFDYSIITNPWLCINTPPRFRYTAGIAFDMVPNLLACGILSFGRYLDIFEFAHHHDVGYKFFLDNVESINCISRSTETDFRSFYSENRHDPRIAVKLPFRLPDEQTTPLNVDELGLSPKVLLVNVLDPRKNFFGVAETLRRLQGLKFDVDIVGFERIPTDQAFSFLHELSNHGRNVRWFRRASDDELANLYRDATALLFPSLYEGLGLPILEAQARGLPVVTSNTSSCGEINVNTSLKTSPDDYDGLADRLRSVLVGDGAVAHGPKLRTRLSELLAAYVAAEPSSAAFDPALRRVA